MCSKNYKQKEGFTLAEVLVTLAVIGIVAALTIPSLIKTSNEKEIVTTLKKNYSMLSQATIAINADCNGSILNCLTDPNAGDNDLTTRREIMALYSQKLKVVKDCDNGTGCFSSETYKYLNGDSYSQPNATWTNKILLNNGSAIALDWGIGGVVKFALTVDCNNKKSPNQIGRDTFIFVYNNNTNMIEPAGVSWATSCIVTSSGVGCTAKVLQEGGINY